jgi:ABC-type cobalamin/Fe3+-siderophores transport system ATPase subunit
MPFELTGVSFSYSEKKVIDDISMSFDPGMFCGIIGPNGCGKTTLLDLLAKHRRPTAGRIAYKGRDLGTYSAKELSKEIALVPQNFYINFPFTVEEVVMMGRYPHIPRFSAPSAEDVNIVQDIMEKTEVSEFTDRFINELSGGERQRVVFARALAQGTQVLILDEATSNLDINHSISLLNICERRMKQQGKTIISVMQDINLAAVYCDYLVFMSGGRIAIHGATRDVLNPGTMRQVFNVDAKVYAESYSDSLQVVFKK